MLDSFNPNPLYDPQAQQNQTQTPTQAQTFAPASSITGGTNLFWKPQEEEEQQNKNSGLGVLGRTLVTLPQSIGKGFTNQLDKISDTPANIRNALAQKDAAVMKDFGSWNEAQKSQNNFQYHADTHLLGQGVQNWEQRVDEKQQAILDDNPTSKLAKAGVYANELGESVGAMIPTIAASALTGGLMSAAAGGPAALGAKAAFGTKSAIDTLSTISKVSEAAGLGAMFMGVYSNSLEEAVKNGADYNAASKKALLDGLLEVGTEKMFAGIAGLGEGIFSSTAKKVVNSNGADALVKATGIKKAGLTLANMINRVSEMAEAPGIRGLLFDALGEASEEMVAEFFGPYIERATTNPYAENATLEEILRAGLGGALISFAMNPVGKITGKLTSPSEDAMRSARLEFRTTNPDQVIANIATLTFQDVSSAEDIAAIERIIDRKLNITPVMIGETQTGTYADGIVNPVRQRQAVAAIQEAIDAGKTPQAIQTLRQKMSQIWDEEVLDRQTKAGARAFADKVSEDRLNNNQNYQNLKSQLEDSVAKYEEALNRAEELEAAAKAEGATEEAKKAYEDAVAAVRQADNAYREAYKKEKNARTRIRRDVDYRLTEEQVRSEYGDAFVDNFTMAKRVMQAREGQAYIAGKDGEKRVFDKYEYAEDLGGRYYTKAERKSKTLNISDEERQLSEQVDNAFSQYQKEVRKELNDFKNDVNKALKDRGVDLQVKIGADGHGNVSSYFNGVITFDPAAVSSAMGAQFLLAHELLHAVDDKFMTTSQFDQLGAAIEKSMEAIKFDYENAFSVLASLYGPKYIDYCRAEAKKKGFKDRAEAEEYANKLLERMIREEVYARFMSTAFGSDSILQSLALVSPALLQNMKSSVEKSSIANLPNTLWDYTRWQILDRINKALTAPVDPEDLKDDLEIDKEMAFARLSDDYHINPVDNMYSKVERALNTMSLNDFKSVFNSDDALVSAIAKYGVKKEEIEYSKITKFAGELRKMVKDKAISVEEAKSELADLVSGVFTNEYTGVLDETILGEREYAPANWGDYQYNPNDARDYREYLYKMLGNTFEYAMHWPGHEGVVVHLRANMRDTANGEPVFFVEEAQSDLHSKAQKKTNGVRTARYSSENADDVINDNKKHLPEVKNAEKALRDELTGLLNGVDEGVLRETLKTAPQPFILKYPNDYVSFFTGEILDSEEEAKNHVISFIDGLSKNEIVDELVKVAIPDRFYSDRYGAYEEASRNAAQAIDYFLGEATAADFFRRYNQAEMATDYAERSMGQYGLSVVPDAPYKKDRAQMYAMQRALGNAIKENAKYIAWTTAKMQSDRYSGMVPEENYAQEYDRYIPKTFGKYAENLGGKLVRIPIKENRASGSYDPLIGFHGRLSEKQVNLINDYEYGKLNVSAMSNDDAQFLADYMMANHKMEELEYENERAAAAGFADLKDFILSDILYQEFPERYPELNPALDNKTTEVQAIEITPELKKNIEEKGQPRWAFARLSDTDENFKDRLGPLDESGDTGIEEFYDYYRNTDQDTFVDPFTGEEKKRSSGAYVIEPQDGMYSKIEQAINKMSLNDFKSVFNSDDALIGALSKMGVKKEEIEYSYLLADIAELRKDVKNKAITVGMAKNILADLSGETKARLFMHRERKSGINNFDEAWSNGGDAYSKFQFDPELADDYRAYTYSMMGNSYESPHWKSRGVVSHLRSNIRDTVNGESVYFVEENQSDLHSAAQGKGAKYLSQLSTQELAEQIKLRKKHGELKKQFSNYVDANNDVGNRITQKINEAISQDESLEDALKGLPKSTVWVYDAEGQGYLNTISGEWLWPEQYELLPDDERITPEAAGVIISYYGDSGIGKLLSDKLLDRGIISESDIEDSKETKKKLEDARSALRGVSDSIIQTVQDAPYRKDRASLYTMQMALAEAVREGTKYIAWTPAWIQNERWSDDFDYGQIYDKRIPKEFGKYAEKLGGELTKIQLDYSGNPTAGFSGFRNRLMLSAYNNYIDYVNNYGYESSEYNRWYNTLLDDNQRQFIRDLRSLSDNPSTAFDNPEEIGDLASALYEKYPDRYSSFKTHHDKIGNGKNGIEVQAIEITPKLRENIAEYGQPRFAFARLSDQHNQSNIDHMYAKSAEALGMMSDQSFRSSLGEPKIYLRKYLKKFGITDEEIKQLGIIPEAEALKERIAKGEITEAQARDYLIERAENEGILEEIIHPNTRKEKSVYTEKTLLGDFEKYADYLYTLPTSHPGANFVSGHWDEPGVLVHIRADRRYTPDGKSVFFVEENQSDYHNQAHKKDDKTKQRIGSYQDNAPAMLEDVQAKLDNANNLTDEEYKALREEERRLITAVPHAYYESDFAEKYAMKRALLHAIENGDDYLAWTTPKMQENRWSENYSKAYRNTYGLRIPGFMDRYVKQWGSKVEPISLSVSYRGVPANSYSAMSAIMPKNIMPSDPNVSQNGTYEVYGVKITPEMKKDILENGQSRWGFMRFGDYDVDIDDQRAQEYADFVNKYGVSAEGLPRKIAQHIGVNQTVGKIATGWNTASKTLNERLVNAVLEGEEGITHIIMTDEAAKLDALKRIRSHQTIGEAYTEAINVLSGKKVADKNDLVFGEQLLVDMAKQLRNIEEGADIRANESKDPTELLNQMQQLIANLCAAGTRAGQNLQAFRLLNKLTPTGRLYYIEAQVNAYLSEMVDRRGNSRVGGYRYQKDAKGHIILDEKGKPKTIKISDSLRQKMEACTTQEEMDAVEKDIIEDIASQIPPTLTDRVVAWRYLAMLGNPRTHIRNMVSNYAMGVAVRAKDRVGGVLEDIFLKDRDVVGRTKTSRRIDPALKKSLEEFADNDWTQDNVSEYALSGGKVGFKSKIDERRNKLGYKDFTFLDKVSKKNSDWLEAEDDWAAKRAYKRAFVSYCAANNLTPEYLKSGTTASNTRLAQARSYAVNEAAKATYHDANALATHLNQIEKMNGASKIIVGGLVPFKKTPANILKRGIEYSPLSIVSGIKQFRDAKSLNTDDFIQDRMGEFNAAAGNDKLTGDSPNYKSGAEAAKDISKVNGVSKAELRYSAEATKTKMMADALDKLASGLTGTMIMMLGMLLGHLGLMKGAGDENKREEYYDQMLGNQEYSATFFGKNITLDWLTPVSMPLFTGVELMKMIDEDGNLSFNEALDAVERLADPVMNLSVLQGINQSMSQYESGLGKMVLSAGESYIGQFIPTLAGQIARSIDPTRRTTYAAKEGEGLGGDLEKFRNRLENKIPFLASTNSAYVDMWGRQDVDTDPFLVRLVKNSALPMYIKEQNKTVADDYITTLFDQTGDRSVIPNSPDSSFTFDGTKVYLMSDEYQATKEIVGQISNVGVTSLMSVPGVAYLSSDEQADLVAKVYSFARAMAKMEYANSHDISDYDPDGTNMRLYNAVNAGMTIGEAIYVNHIASGFTADKDANGNSISGTKKAKILNFYHSLGLTEEQIIAIIPSTYTYP